MCPRAGEQPSPFPRLPSGVRRVPSPIGVLTHEAPRSPPSLPAVHLTCALAQECPRSRGALQCASGSA
eukprot:scaffold6580_cov60-Phaeocystis_antarctica.AAC.2